MTNKTLGWLDIGTLGVFFVLYFGGAGDTSAASIFAIAYIVFNVWAGIRLIRS